MTIPLPSYAVSNSVYGLTSYTLLGPLYNPPGGGQRSEVKSNLSQIKVAKRFASFALYKKQKRRLPPQPYEISRTLTNNPWGSYRRPYEIFTGAHGGSSGGAQVPDFDQLEARAVANAVNKFLLGLKDGKFNAVVVYAEAHQVQRLIMESAVKLAGVYGHLRKGQLQAAGSRLGLTFGKRVQARYTREHKRLKTDADIDKMMSNGVLSVQYGIRPLISDIVGAAELYAQKMTAEVRNTFRVTKTIKVDERSKGYYLDPYGYGTSLTYLSVQGQVKVNIACTFSSGNDVVHTAKQLGITNPLLVAWELLPWSFVIDWFIPIGNYLSSLDATVGLQFTDGYQGVKTDLVRQTDQVFTAAGGYGPYVKTGTSRSSISKRKFKRTILSSFPSPRLPEFKNPLSIEHALNAIALLAQFKKTVYSRKP